MKEKVGNMRIYDQNIIPDLTFQQILGESVPVEEFLYNPQAYSGTFDGSTFQGGKTKFDNTEVGFIMGVDGGTPKFYIGNTVNYLNWTGTALNIAGAISASTIDIGGADATSFHVDADGNLWLGAATFASAPAKISNAGAATFQSVTLSSSVAISGIANNANTDIHLLDFTHNITFSASDEDTVAWTSGTITLSNGRTFSISSGNTGDMSARTYIYLDPGVSSTVLQATTTVTTAVGANKILMGYAQNTNELATFVSSKGLGGLSLDGDSINVANLGAINASLGYVEAGLIRGSVIETSLDGTGTRFKLTDTAFQGYDASENVVFEVVLAGGGNEINVDSYADSNFQNYVRINGSLDGHAQSFTGVAGDIINAKFKIAKVGSPTGNIVAKLYAHSGTFGTSSVPTGAALATSDNFDLADINTYYTSVTFTFSGGNQYTMSAATKYVIAIEYSSATSTNYLKVGTDAQSPTHGGNRSQWNGSSWSAVSSSDMIFSVNATTGDSAVGDVIMGDDATGSYAKWNNTAGTFQVFADNVPQSIVGSFGGDGSDGALSASSGTTTVDVGGARVYVLNYSSISLTGTAKLTITNQHSNGTIVFLKSQGDITLTSSATVIDLAGKGGAGGAGGTAGLTATNGADGKIGTSFATVEETSAYGKLGTASVSGVGVGTGGAASTQYGGDYTLTDYKFYNKFIAVSCGAGGGGGGGADFVSGASVGTNGGAGGNGGGCLIIECRGSYTFTTGTISVDGADGADAPDASSTSSAAGGGGGGGGSAGMILVFATTISSDTGTYSATPGAGGAGGDAVVSVGTPEGLHGAGGGGGAAGLNGAGSAGGNGNSNGNGTNGSNSTDAGGGGGGGASRDSAGTFTGGTGGTGGANQTDHIVRVVNNFFA